MEIDQNEINCASKSMQFASVLDVSLWVRIVDSLVNFASFGNSGMGAPNVISTFYFIVLMIQIVGPSLLVCAKDIWPEDNPITSVFNVIGYVWHGPSDATDGKYIMSLILGIFFTIFLITIFKRAMSYKHYGNVSTRETVIIVILMKYVFIIITPHLLAGVPQALYQAFIGKNATASIFTVSLAWLFSFNMYYYVLIATIVPRVLVEGSICHEWSTGMVAMVHAAASLSSAMESCLSFVTAGSARVIFPIVIFVTYTIVGIVIILFFPCLNKQTNIIISTTCFSSALTVLVGMINLVVHKMAGEIILLVFCAAWVLFYMGCKMFVTKRAERLLALCDELSQNREEAVAIMDKEFKGEFDFIGKVRTIVEYWNPYLAEGEIFDYGMNRWKDGYYTLSMYGRIMSFFPDKTSKMVWIARRLSTIKTTKPVTPFLLQFRHIARTRQFQMSPHIIRQLSEAETKSHQLETQLRRFWENILQKNSSAFWEDADKISERQKELDRFYQQLIEEYPNNKAVHESYVKFTQDLQKDSEKTGTLKANLDKLLLNGRFAPDMSMTSAVLVYPILQNYMSNTAWNVFGMETEDHQSDNESVNEISGSLRQCESVAEDGNRVMLAIQDLTKHSKLGGILGGSLIILVMTFVVIGLLIFYYISYHDLFVNRYVLAKDMMKTMHKTYGIFSRMILEINILPNFLFTGPAAFKLSYMKTIAPRLYPDAIPLMEITRDSVSERLKDCGPAYENVLASLANITDTVTEIEMLYDIFARDIVHNGKTTKSTISKMFLDAQNVLNTMTDWSVYSSESYASMMSYFSVLSTVWSNASDVLTRYTTKPMDDSLRIYKERMLLVIIVAILSITIPYILQLLILDVQSEAIAESFFYFPNTEIRNVITRLGSSGSNIDDDVVTQASRLSQGKRNSLGETLKLVIPFFGSFMVVIICCLASYYTALDFVSMSTETTIGLSTMYIPFNALEVAMTYMLRIYNSDIDPTTLGTDTRDMMFGEIDSRIRAIANAMYRGMWGSPDGMRNYYHEGHVNFDYFNDTMPSTPAVKESIFERLATATFPNAMDLIICYIETFLSEHKIEKVKPGNEVVMSLLYFFLTFGPEKRLDYYIACVEASVDARLVDNSDQEMIILVFAIVWQLISCAILLMYIFYSHAKIRRALSFFHFISPTVLTDNHNALTLIETGSKVMDATNTVFSNADDILSKVNQGVAITDRNLIISNFNRALVKITNLSVNEILGASIRDIIKEEGDYSWPNVIHHITEALKGRTTSSFSSNVVARLRNNKLITFHCNIIALTPIKVAIESEASEIETVAFLIDDTTKYHIQEKQMEDEQATKEHLINRVIPKRIVDEMLKGRESMSFAVQSITVCDVKITTSKKWKLGDSRMIDFYENITAAFDEVMADFPTLCKVKGTYDAYTFAGGLFAETNRPEKHAGETVRFALRLLVTASELAQKYDTNIDLCIGVHTGGPVVAGVMSVSRPNFQIIGPVMEQTKQMRMAGVVGQIHITRAVYDLVFSGGFHVQERGEIQLRGNKTMSTYFVLPT